jgi:hypothetical protein
MMKVNVSEYLRKSPVAGASHGDSPGPASGSESSSDVEPQLVEDPSYSVLIGYGFRSLKRRARLISETGPYKG